MDQAELRQWEHKCVQEEAPKCVAACPLHVDVRGFCSLAGQKRWDKAWQVLAKTLPLPGVLARLCSGPCRDACVREQAGGAVRMDLLERFCAGHAKAVPPPRPLPSKHKSVAVLGGGFTGLCAAWEMGRRGYEVVLYCDEPGRDLRGISEDVLPALVLDHELESLTRLHVAVEQGSDLTPALLTAQLEERDAVFVDRLSVPGELLDFGEPDELTLGTDRAGLFAGRAGGDSAIFQAADGRRAANSVERFIQGVSMVTSRELEGPYETRLFTSLAKVESVPPACAEGECGEDQARDEALRCLQCQCMECVNVCEYLRHFKQYPKVYVRQIYNNESIVMGTRQANKMINSCMLCGLCETVCPEDFAMAEVCLQARRTLVEQGNMPPSAHEFALRDMAFADSEKCALARHAPGASTSEYLFFPGCQLTASDPDAVRAAYGDLLARLGSVGLMLHCCSAPALWAGRQDLQERAAAVLKSQWEGLGSPRLIVACPTCLQTLHQVLPDAELVSYWSVMRTLGLPPSARGADTPLAVNDPCAARHEPVLREDVRWLLNELGVDVVEPELTGETTQCCGYGGLLAEANPDLGRAAAKRRGECASQDLVTYCAMCRDMIAGSGKRTLHLFDLLFPGEGDRAARPSPGYSARRENRARLRESLLGQLWGEIGASKPEPWETLSVDYTDKAREVMEERRILESDVRKVLHHAGETGRHLVNDETGHMLASYRPVVVTYWVEYEIKDDGYLVHNTWCHRMRIKGGQE